MTFIRLSHENADLRARLERAEEWKRQAMEVMDGLQELGKALDLPLGAQVTGPHALTAIADLCSRLERAEADTIRRVVEALRSRADEYGNAGTISTASWFCVVADHIEREFASTGEDAWDSNDQCRECGAHRNGFASYPVHKTGCSLAPSTGEDHVNRIEVPDNLHDTCRMVYTMTLRGWSFQGIEDGPILVFHRRRGGHRE